MTTPASALAMVPLKYDSSSSDSEDDSSDSDAEDELQPGQLLPVPSSPPQQPQQQHPNPQALPTLPSGSAHSAPAAAPSASASDDTAVSAAVEPSPASAAAAGANESRPDPNETEEEDGTVYHYSAAPSSSQASASAAATASASAAASAPARMPAAGARFKEARHRAPPAQRPLNVQRRMAPPPQAAALQAQAAAKQQKTQSYARHGGKRIEHHAMNGTIVPFEYNSTFQFDKKTYKVKSVINDTMVVPSTGNAQAAVAWEKVSSVTRAIPVSLQDIHEYAQEYCHPDTQQGIFAQADIDVLTAQYGEAAASRYQLMMTTPITRPDFVAVQIFPPPPDGFNLAEWTQSFVMLENETDILEVSANGTGLIFKAFYGTKNWRKAAAEHLTNNLVIHENGDDYYATAHVPIRCFFGYLNQQKANHAFSSGEAPLLASAASASACDTDMAAAAAGGSDGTMRHHTKRPRSVATLLPPADPSAAAAAAAAASAMEPASAVSYGGASALERTSKVRRVSGAFDAPSTPAAAAVASAPTTTKSLFPSAYDNHPQLLSEATIYVERTVIKQLKKQARDSGTSLVIEFKRWVKAYECLNDELGVPTLVERFTGSKEKTEEEDQPRVSMTQVSICQSLWRFFLFVTPMGRRWIDRKFIELENQEIESKPSAFV